MSANAHALHRSVAALSFGIVRDVQKKAAADGQEGLTERDHQLQVPISGTASPNLVNAHWREFNVTFETGFPADSAGHRDPSFENPHFTFGYEMSSGQAVMLTACVRSWKLDGNRNVTGAAIRVAALAIGSPKNVKFAGVLHLNFQGWGAPINDNTPEDVGV